MLIYTVGYGNRAIGDFIDLLKHYGVQCLVDTRSVPYSRFRSDFRKQALQKHLGEAGLEYRYLGDALGGKRVDPACVVNGMVDLDLMADLPAVRQALGEVEDAVRAGALLAIMCAELRPDQCHRSRMLAPLLEARGFEVLHIDELGSLKTQQEVRGWFGDA